MKTQLAILVSLLVMLCDVTPACLAEQLTPIIVNRVTSVRVSGPPMRRYEPLAIVDAFGRGAIREAYAFFPELASMDSAKGIEPVATAKMNRVVLQLQGKVNGSYDFELHVLEGSGVWTCRGKYFKMKNGWKEFLAKEFARQEKDRSEQGEPKILHVDKENAEKLGLRVQVGSFARDGYERFNYRQFNVYLKPELAAKFEHSFLSYFRDREYLLGAAANSREMDDGQLRLVFNVNPTIAKDVGFRIQIAQKPRPILYRFDLSSFLRIKAVKTTDQEPLKVRLVGEWVGTDDEDCGWVASFEHNGKFELVRMDRTRPQRDNLRVIGTYKVDSSVRPTQLKIEAICKDAHGQYMGSVIVEMIDKNKFRMSNPSLFSPKAFDKRSFVMQRQGTADAKTAPEPGANREEAVAIVVTPRKFVSKLTDVQYFDVVLKNSTPDTIKVPYIYDSIIEIDGELYTQFPKPKLTGETSRAIQGNSVATGGTLTLNGPFATLDAKTGRIPLKMTTGKHTLVLICGRYRSGIVRFEFVE